MSVERPECIGDDDGDSDAYEGTVMENPIARRDRLALMRAVTTDDLGFAEPSPSAAAHGELYCDFQLFESHQASSLRLHF